MEGMGRLIEAREFFCKAVIILDEESIGKGSEMADIVMSVKDGYKVRIGVIDEHLSAKKQEEVDGLVRSIDVLGMPLNY